MKLTHTLTAKMLAVFETVPDLYLILSPTLVILTASNAYLKATLTQRETLVGKPIFEAFPDNPSEPQANGVKNLRDSLYQALYTKQPHQMPLQHYDVPRPDSLGGGFEEKYWIPLNTPVLDELGNVLYVIHKAEDVTEKIQARKLANQSREQLESVNEILRLKIEEVSASNIALTGARAETDLERSRLYSILMQAPASICIFEGPTHIFKLVNPSYQKLVGNRQILGKPVAEAMPELEGQLVFRLLDNVFRTGESFHAHEMKIQLDHDNAGTLEHNYYNFIYQAMRNLEGDIEGILLFAYQVTSQVEARRQLEESEEALHKVNLELTASNEELTASSEEIIAANEELLETQKQLQQLNTELEMRVAERTYELENALQETQQHRSQLLEQQALLERILGQVPASIATLAGPEHRLGFFNASYQQLSGNRAGLGQKVAEVFPEVIEQGFIQLLDQVYATGQPFIGTETPAMLYDSATGKPEQRYVDFIYQPLMDNEGHPQSILVFVVDVTERVLARRQVETLQTELLTAARHQIEIRETFYQVFEQTPAAICIQHGPEHVYEFINPAYQALFPDREFIGSPIAEAMPETVVQGFVSLLDKVYQTGETFFGYELPITITRAGENFSRTSYFNFTYKAYWENGNISGISTFAIDVTEGVQARREADQQRELLHNLFIEAPVPIVILEGPELVYRLVNAAYQLIFPGRTLLNKALLEALPELINSPIPGILRQVYETGETYVAQEMPLMLARVQGGPLECIYWTFTYQARRNRQGEVDGILVFAYEVTDQVRSRQVVVENERQAQAMTVKLASANDDLKSANAQIQSTNEDLAESNRQLLHANVDLDNFIYTASHDLKAPISNIESLLSALLRTLPAESLQSGRILSITTLMGESIDRFKKTIANLTEVVKLQKENSGEIVTINLLAIIREVCLDLQPLTETTKAKIQVEVESATSVRFSEKNLRSVVYNLLSNAIKYHSPERLPSVTISCVRTENYHLLTIQDNGLGMESARLNQLFMMFKRFHDHVEGTGIGLYMVKKMVENAGGKIEVESRLGEGSTFRVYFPL